MTDLTIARVAAPVREEVMRLLRRAIATGELKAGERLSEVELGAQLQVSRTTVREAFRQLEAEKLIEVIPGKGPVVATIGPVEAAELYEIREAFECLAVRLFTERQTAEDLRALRHALRVVQLAYADQVIQQILPAKDEFYGTLYRGARNASLAAMAATLSVRVSRLRVASLSSPGRLEVGPQELHSLVQAIEAHDAERAVLICRTHVRNAAAAASQSDGHPDA